MFCVLGVVLQTILDVNISTDTYLYTEILTMYNYKFNSPVLLSWQSCNGQYKENYENYGKKA